MLSHRDLVYRCPSLRITGHEIRLGAANDIESAVEIARKMVREFGMSPLGPIYLVDSQTDTQSQNLLDKAEDAITNIVNSQLEERARS